MSDQVDTGDDGHVSSTNTNGKYLNPDLYEGIIEELYSERTPLDLLHETCNKIGKDTESSRKGATEVVSARTQSKELDKRTHPSNRRSSRRPEARDDRDDVIVLDWCPVSKSSSEELIDVDSLDDQPEDLRCWLRGRSPDGSTRYAGSLGGTTTRRTAVGMNRTSPVTSSPTDDENHFYPKTERKISGKSGANLPHSIPEVENLDYGDKYPGHPYLPAYYDTEALLRQYLELQSIAHTTVLQDYLTRLQQMAFRKSSKVVSSANLVSGGVANEMNLIQWVPEVLARQALVSQLRFEGALMGGAALGGMAPFGLPYLSGGGVGGLSPIQVPSFDQRHLVEKIDNCIHRNLLQRRPDLDHPEIYQHQQRSSFVKQLSGLHGKDSSTTTELFHSISPDTSTTIQSPHLPTSPKSPMYPKYGPHGNSPRSLRSSYPPRGTGDDLRRHHPYKHPIFSSHEISSRSFDSFDRISRSNEGRVHSKGNL